MSLYLGLLFLGYEHKYRINYIHSVKFLFQAVCQAKFIPVDILGR